MNFLRVFGRLTTGIDRNQAQSELTAICRALRQQFPVSTRKEAVRVDALHEALVGDFRQAMLILLAAVIVVLATALANLASLALVRANDRRPELTMRIAIGASRLYIARQLTVEGLMLAVTGTVFGWMLAAQAIAAAMLWAPPSVPRLDEVSLDGTVVVFAAAVTAFVTVVLTIAPLAVIARTLGRCAQLDEPWRDRRSLESSRTGMRWSCPRFPPRWSCSWRRSSSSRICAGSTTCTPGSTRMASSRRVSIPSCIDRPKTSRDSMSGCRIDSARPPACGRSASSPSRR